MGLPRRAIHPSADSRAAIVAAAGRLRPADELRDWYATYVRNHADRLALDVDLVRAVAHGGPVLDIGSTPPVLLAALAAGGHEVAGVDLAPERCPTDLDIRACDVERQPLPFEEERFAVVVFNELFEHLRIDPLLAVREAARVLKRTGCLLLSTPNARSYLGIKNFLVHGRVGWCETDIYEQYAKLERLGHMGHVREYTFVEVRELLEHLGVEVEHVVWRGRGTGRAHRIDRMIPSLAPYMTLVAAKR